MTYDEWKAEGERLFGPDEMMWRFVCPVCKYEQSGADFKAARAPSTAVAFSCIGRWLPREHTREAFGGKGPGPCSYAGGGLFKRNPVVVTLPDGEEHRAFAFASVEPCSRAGEAGPPTP